MSGTGARNRSGPSAPEPAWPVRSGRLPVITDFLCPRPETGYGLDAGTAGLPRGTGAGQPGMTVLAGPSGYGKTHLAAALLVGAARSATSDLQVWVNGSSPSAVVTGYAQAAADLGLAHGGIQPEAAASMFLGWLRGTERPWVVVLDNMTDSGGLRGLWPVGAAGQVLITCHQSADLSELTPFGPRVCRIGEFSPREALSYLTARLYDDADKRVEAVDLAADLGYIPLALALASATMIGTTVSCRQYRARFAGRMQELLGRLADGAVSLSDIAWSLAIDRADQQPPAGLARPVLALAALLDPAGLPVSVTTSRAALAFLSARSRGMPAQEKQVLAALANLAQCGLISIDQTASPVLVAVHPTVQETVRRLVPGPVLDDAARAAADAVIEVWPRPGSDPALEQALRGCAGWLGGIAGDLLWLPEPHPVLLRAGTSLGDAGFAGSAVAYWTSMMTVSARTLGPDHAQTLAIRDLLAAACESAGRMADAVELIRAGVADRERTSGTGHPDTLTARGNLARAYRASGQYDAAIDAYQRLASDREWVLGAEHPDTMTARSQLAGTYLAAGQADLAIAMYQQNVADWERLLNPEHRTVLTECLNLGTACQSAGRIDEAITIFGRVRSVEQKTLGPNHPETARAASYQAFALKKAGRLKEAIALYRQALAGREAALGGDHPETLTSLANLASCYHSAHRMKDAIPLYERLLAARERIQGADHPDALTARGNLAGAYHSAGRLADAIPVYELTLADFERVLGPDHPDTLTLRANLADAYYTARRHSDAIAMLKRTYEACERALGPDHALTRTIGDNLDAITRLSSPARRTNCKIRTRYHLGNGKLITWQLAFY